MNDVSVTLEHVDLLDGLDGLGVQLLQGGLELLVVVGVPGDIALLLVSRGTLATCDSLFGLVIWSSWDLVSQSAHIHQQHMGI